MARAISGVGRVTVFPLLHDWPDTYGVIAYTTTGHFGVDAVVGYVPLPEVPDVRLMDVAARHAAQTTEWVLCTGWSSRVVPKPGTLDLRDTEWSLEVDGSSTPGKVVYGHQQLHVGRMSLKDPELMPRVREVLHRRVGGPVSA
ncbi:hypothetical protein [Streptomyces chattanoogensis]|uniref:Uncharacterized protein n=1 Tax=Streptomyces chattanoogensis TaxID=66876 RepID=A0A0N0XXA4_9ACTN|nr:hypothetical protein [Streptomyces chattanoogensis]KPC62275.1 hypothetical protein ADL29_21220 [Streptomyces chattanoogensis]